MARDFDETILLRQISSNENRMYDLCGDVDWLEMEYPRRMRDSSLTGNGGKEWTVAPLERKRDHELGSSVKNECQKD